MRYLSSGNGLPKQYLEISEICHVLRELQATDELAGMKRKKLNRTDLIKALEAVGNVAKALSPLIEQVTKWKLLSLLTEWLKQQL